MTEGTIKTRSRVWRVSHEWIECPGCYRVRIAQESITELQLTFNTTWTPGEELPPGNILDKKYPSVAREVRWHMRKVETMDLAKAKRKAKRGAAQ